MLTACHSTLTEMNYSRTTASSVSQVADAILNKEQSHSVRLRTTNLIFFILINTQESVH